MNKKLILTLVMTIGITVVLCCIKNQMNNQEEANNVVYTVKDNYKIINLETFYTNQKQVKNTVTQSVASHKENETKKVKRPHITDIPLDDKVLDYIYQKANENNIAYTLVLAIMKVESNFDPYAVSSTNDHGLSQINKTTAKWIAKELGLSKYDLTNPYTSTDFCIFYLKYLSEKYRNMGISEEDVFDLTIVSYNMGEGKGYKYVKKHGAEKNSYWKKVMKAKEELEMSIDE